MELIGHQLKNKSKASKVRSPIVPSSVDGTEIITGGLNAGGFMSHYLNQDGDKGVDSNDLILKYRRASIYPECELAIDDIVNESIVFDDSEAFPVKLAIQDADVGETMRKKISEELVTVLRLLNFGSDASDIFKRWYIDGRLYYHIVVDTDNPKKGIQELRYINPLHIKKVREIEEENDPKTGLRVIKNMEEFFIYNSNAHIGTGFAGELKLTDDSVIFVPSGYYDPATNKVVSPLHKALKPLNQLQWLEDSLVIYRLSRAPERRIFYIDIGNLPKGKAEEYVKSIMNKYTNKMVYDVNTGEMKDDKRHMSMMEDFWLPRRENGRSTEITTLPGACLSMDTSVSLLDGRELSIRDIESELLDGKTLWTYSCHPVTGEVVPGKISWAGVTQKSAKVMKITLDNGEDIICTPNHKFPIYGKGFVEACDLKENESLIPLYRKKKDISADNRNKKDYEQFFDNECKKWKYTHKVVADYFRDDICPHWVYKIPNNEYSVRHHIDFNRFNNSPENLCFMSWKDHSLYHSDNAVWPEWAGEKGRESHRENLKRLKDESPEQYNEYCRQRSITHKTWWDSLTEEERIEQSNKCKNYYQNLSGEDLQRHINKCRKNVAQSLKRLRRIREEAGDEYRIYRNKLSNAQKKSWDNDVGARRDSASACARKNNLERWQGPKSKHYKELHSEKQKMSFSHEMLLYVIDLVKDKTTHEFTINNVVEALNKNETLRWELHELNKDKNIPNYIHGSGFNSNIVKKLVSQFGYSNWLDFRKKEGIHNHRIVKIEYLDEEIEVGTLRVDDEEEYHNYHTFALSAGVFTKNSNLSEIEDILYFQRKLYKALNVPTSRLEQDSSFALGRASEISRDELKFQKFVNKLRRHFSVLILKALKTQLILKNIITLEEWESLYSNVITVDYVKDSHFTELKNSELLSDRLNIMRDIESYVGKYFSKKWVQRNVLHMSDEEIEESKNEIDEEKKSGELPDEESDDGF